MQAGQQQGSSRSAGKPAAGQKCNVLHSTSQQGVPGASRLLPPLACAHYPERSLALHTPLPASPAALTDDKVCWRLK